MVHELAILTLSRNLGYLTRLMEALQEQVAPPLPFVHVVVNNANSMALTAAAVKRRAWVLEPGYNTTFSAGNNMAAQAVPEAKHYLLLNDDAIPEPLFLSALWARRHDAEVVGALLLNADGTVNHAGTSISALVTDHIGRGRMRAEFEGVKPVHVPAATFAAALISGNFWRHVGGLCELYRYGWEDTDFCMQALEQGATVMVARDAVAVHDECGTRPRGGDADCANYDTFNQRWRDKIPALLAGYKERFPDVQGIEGDLV